MAQMWWNHTCSILDLVHVGKVNGIGKWLFRTCNTTISSICLTEILVIWELERKLLHLVRWRVAIIESHRIFGTKVSKLINFNISVSPAQCRFRRQHLSNWCSAGDSWASLRRCCGNLFERRNGGVIAESGLCCRIVRLRTHARTHVHTHRYQARSRKSRLQYV